MFRKFLNTVFPGYWLSGNFRRRILQSFLGFFFTVSRTMKLGLDDNVHFQEA